MTVKLPREEIFIYFVVWVFSVSFAYYKIYLVGPAFEKSNPNDFVDGWTILQRKKDSSDGDWELWTNFSIQLAPWLILHIFISEIIRIFCIEAIPLGYVLITMFALLYYFPVVVSAFLIIQLSLFFVCVLTSSKLIIWILGLFFLFTIEISNDMFMETTWMDYGQHHLTTILTSWFLIRCIDFALSEIKGSSKQWTRFLNLLGYAFYLPCFFFGPFIPYDYFKLQVYKTQLDYKKRVLNLCHSLIKCLLYYFMFEFLSHFLYCNAMHYDINNFISNGMWTLSGIGICMANFFYLKYLVIYGFSTGIANCENFKTPDHPKCIYRIHLYSKMWRYFDRGFYFFMFRCIYSPVCGKKTASIYRKSFASLLCFLFIYIWHGGTTSVFYWSSFNFFGLIFEAIGRRFWNNASVNKWLVSNFTQENLRRFEALVASPLWILAVISNFMFFGEYGMGIVFIEQLLKGSLILYVSVIMIAYCMCQVSIETNYLESRTHHKCHIAND